MCTQTGIRNVCVHFALLSTKKHFFFSFVLSCCAKAQNILERSLFPVCLTFAHTNVLVSWTLAIYFIPTDRSLNQLLTNHRIQSFLQWPVVARWLPTGLYASLVNPALAHCFCWTSTPRFWCSRGSASQTNWLFYGGHIFLFYTVYDVYTDKKLKFSFLRWKIWFCGPCKYWVQIPKQCNSLLMLFVRHNYVYSQAL